MKKDGPLCIFDFDSKWPEAPNALFKDNNGQFYVGDFKNGEFENLKEVTIPEALDWYAEANKYSTEGSSGSIGSLCEAAAKLLADLQTWNEAWELSVKQSTVGPLKNCRQPAQRFD